MQDSEQRGGSSMRSGERGSVQDSEQKYRRGEDEPSSPFRSGSHGESHRNSAVDGRLSSRINPEAETTPRIGQIPGSRTDSSNPDEKGIQYPYQYQHPYQHQYANQGLSQQVRGDSPGESVFFSSSIDSQEDFVEGEKGRTGTGGGSDIEGRREGKMKSIDVDSDRKGNMKGRDVVRRKEGEGEEKDRKVNGERRVADREREEERNRRRNDDRGGGRGEETSSEEYRPLQYGNNPDNTDIEADTKYSINNDTKYLQERLLSYERQRQKILSNSINSNSKNASASSYSYQSEGNIGERRRDEITSATRVAERDRDQIRLIINEERQKEEIRTIALRIVREEKEKEVVMEREKEKEKEKKMMRIDEMKSQLLEAENKRKYFHLVENEIMLKELSERESKRGREREEEEEVEETRRRERENKERSQRDRNREEEIKIDMEMELKKEMLLNDEKWERSLFEYNSDIGIEHVDNIVKLLHDKVLKRVCKQTQLHMVRYKKRYDEDRSEKRMEKTE